MSHPVYCCAVAWQSVSHVQHAVDLVQASCLCVNKEGNCVRVRRGGGGQQQCYGFSAACSNAMAVLHAASAAVEASAAALLPRRTWGVRWEFAAAMLWHLLHAACEDLRGLLQALAAAFLDILCEPCLPGSMRSLQVAHIASQGVTGHHMHSEQGLHFTALNVV
jgi:hypothetical protein